MLSILQLFINITLIFTEQELLLLKVMIDSRATANFILKEFV